MQSQPDCTKRAQNYSDTSSMHEQINHDEDNGRNAEKPTENIFTHDLLQK